MKIAIRVLTEFDRENVIAFFEKHYLKIPPVWEIDDVTIGSIFWLDNNEKSLFMDDGDEFATPSDYTILEGVPLNMELPKVETTPTRAKELEDFVRFTFNIVDKLQFPTESELKEISNKAKELLNQK